MILSQQFKYFLPENKKEAFTLLQWYKPNCKIMAGGTDLIIQLKGTKLSPTAIVDLKALRLNDSILTADNELRLGSLLTLNALEQNKIVQQKYIALWEAVNNMATPQVRNKATLGGNLCNAAPSADTAPPLIVYGAIAVIESSEGYRQIPVEELFTGPGSAALDLEEILTEVILPLPAKNCGAAYIKHRRTQKDLALVGVAAYLELDEAGYCRKARISLGAVAPTPIRALQAENILKTKKLSAEILKEAGTAAALEAKPITDVRASEGYRLAMVKELTRRALHIAWKRAMGEEEQYEQ